jgi:hypothetical protein
MNYGQVRIWKAQITYLQAVPEPSLRSLSSSSDPCLLGFREFALELAALLTAELTLDETAEIFLERALRLTVLWLSRAWRRRSRIFAEREGGFGNNPRKKKGVLKAAKVR